MLEKKHTKYFESGTIENKKFWDRLGGKPNFSEKSVLDFGCGHGSLCIDVASSGARKIIGVDFGEQAIKQANLYKKSLKLKNTKFIHQDILKFKTNHKFDVVICKGVLPHISNNQKNSR